MAKKPKVGTFAKQAGRAMSSSAARWQKFLEDALSTGGVDAKRVFRDVAGTAVDWMDVWTSAFAASGAPTPPTIFILGNNWTAVNPTRTGTARLESALDPTTSLDKTPELKLLGTGTSTNPIAVTDARLEEDGTQLAVDVTRKGAGNDPPSGMHVGSVFTAGETYLGTIMVWVP